MFFSGFGICTGRRDLSWGFRGGYLLTEEEMGLSLPSARLVEGQARSESVRLALHLPILTGRLSCLACPPSRPPFPPRLSSLVLSLPQRFLQALEPEEVTSYFGPDATLGGTLSLPLPGKGGFSAFHLTMESGAWDFGGSAGTRSGWMSPLLINPVTSCEVDKNWSGRSVPNWVLTPGICSVS